MVVGIYCIWNYGVGYLCGLWNGWCSVCILWCVVFFFWRILVLFMYGWLKVFFFVCGCEYVFGIVCRLRLGGVYLCCGCFYLENDRCLGRLMNGCLVIMLGISLLRRVVCFWVVIFYGFFCIVWLDVYGWVWFFVLVVVGVYWVKLILLWGGFVEFCLWCWCDVWYCFCFCLLFI